MRFGRETGLALLKLEIVEVTAANGGRWWQANEDRFEYSDRSARLYIAAGEAAGQEMATRCRYSPIIFMANFPGWCRCRPASKASSASFSVEVELAALPMQPHKPAVGALKLELCFSIRPNVQTRMVVRQVGVFRSVRKIFADASKIASCARFSGIRTFGRFESEEIAAKGCFDRGSRRPTPPRNRSGGSPSRPAARADAR